MLCLIDLDTSCSSFCSSCLRACSCHASFALAHAHAFALALTLPPVPLSTFLFVLEQQATGMTSTSVAQEEPEVNALLDALRRRRAVFTNPAEIPQPATALHVRDIVDVVRDWSVGECDALVGASNIFFCFCFFEQTCRRYVLRI